MFVDAPFPWDTSKTFAPRMYSPVAASVTRPLTVKVWARPAPAINHSIDTSQRCWKRKRNCGCDVIILDHLSIVVSDQDTGDERKAIDSIMTNLRKLVQETGVGLLLVSHLRRPSGAKAHEDGGKISLGELRGSAAIAQLSDIVIGLERDQQHVDPEIRNTTTVRVLKNRFVGLTGPACYLYYDKESGRMIETSCPTGDDPEVFASIATFQLQSRSKLCRADKRH